MLPYLLRRSAASLLLLFLVVSATFFLLHLAPGDPTLTFESTRVPPAQRALLRHTYGLDRPLPVQYARWLVAVLSGQLGTSLVQGRPVARVVVEALRPTLLLGSAALVIDYGVGLLLGISAARRQGRPFDAAVRVVSLVLTSQPTFWVALMAVLVVSTWLPILPISHMHSTGAEEWSAPARWADLLRHLALPALCLGLPLAGATARFVRASFLEVMGRPFILAARARGLSERRVVWAHGLRNAAIPVVQLLALSVPALLSGSLVTEVIFAWPGLGRLTFDSILARDYPVLLATTMLSAALVLLGNLLADLALAAVDPRVRRP